MKDKTSASLEALTGLLSERQRYEDWLSALESRKSSTPDSVFQKVRSDYQTRFDEVCERLGARAGELKAHIESLTARLQEISRAETTQHESRQEAELRAAVGEYADDEWQRMRQESEKELSRVARERTSVETQLAELNRVFALSTSPAGSGSRAGAGATTVPPLSAVTPRPAVAAEQNGVKRSATSGWPQRDTDSSAGVISVAPGPAAGRPSQVETREGSPAGEFTPLALSAPVTGAEPVKTDEAKGSVAAPAKSKRGGLPDLRTEQQKTLKCPECGATNYPTEWYCERCGGELATL